MSRHGLAHPRKHTCCQPHVCTRTHKHTGPSTGADACRRNVSTHGRTQKHRPHTPPTPAQTPAQRHNLLTQTCTLHRQAFHTSTWHTHPHSDPPTHRFMHTSLVRALRPTGPQKPAHLSLFLLLQVRAEPGPRAGAGGGGACPRSHHVQLCSPSPGPPQSLGACSPPRSLPVAPPPTQSLPGGENHDNTIFPHPGWSPARNTRLRKCCSQAGRYFPYLPLPRPRCLAPPAPQLPGCVRESLPQPGVSSSQPRPRQGATETVPEREGWA